MESVNKGFQEPQQPAPNFFNNSATDEDGRLVAAAPSATPQHQHHFVPLKTIRHATLHLVASTAISIVGIVLAVRAPDLDHRCKAYFIMLYLHIGFWFLTLIVDYILKKTHHNLRICGYLEFYQKTYTLHRAPIYIVSLWNAFLLLVQTLLHHYYPDNFVEQCVRGGIAAPITYVSGFIWVETLILFVNHGFYIRHVSIFNSSQHQPDVQRDHLVEATTRPSQANPTGGQSAQPVAPLTQTLTQTADLLARQADLIRHLREHNEKLSGKLSTTTAQLRSLQHQQNHEKSSA